MVFTLHLTEHILFENIFSLLHDKISACRQYLFLILWYLCSVASGKLGALRLKVRLVEDRILPSVYYQPLIDLLVESVISPTEVNVAMFLQISFTIYYCNYPLLVHFYKAAPYTYLAFYRVCLALLLNMLAYLCLPFYLHCPFAAAVTFILICILLHLNQCWLSDSWLMSVVS